jgi:hypothetical protein
MRQYPWVTVDEQRRSNSLIEKVKSEFVEASGGDAQSPEALSMAMPHQPQTPDVLRVILPTPCWWVWSCSGWALREQKARCTARETQVPGLSPQYRGLRQRHTIDQMYQ